MSLNYAKLAQHPYDFLQLTGLKLSEFQEVIRRVSPALEELEAKKKCFGRTSHLPTIEDKVLCIVMYYRTYVTHTFLGYLFNLHNSNICRPLRRVEPILAKKISIKKDRTLTEEKILKILADVTEQQTQRPQRGQKRYYSGKKKAHTIKTEIVIEADGRILSVSKSHKGLSYTKVREAITC